MTDLRTAAQQALEALMWHDETVRTRGDDEAIEAIRAALVQPEQEPVAWRTFDGEGGYDYRTHADNEDYAAEWAKRNPRHVGWVERLYTAPPQRKPLTEEDITAITDEHWPDFVAFARAVEAAHGIKEPE